jgi:hypothetical protein
MNIDGRQYVSAAPQSADPSVFQSPPHFTRRAYLAELVPRRAPAQVIQRERDLHNLSLADTIGAALRLSTTNVGEPSDRQKTWDIGVSAETARRVARGRIPLPV